MQLAFSSICSERISCTCLLKLHYTVMFRFAVSAMLCLHLLPGHAMRATQGTDASGSCDAKSFAGWTSPPNYGASTKDGVTYGQCGYEADTTEEKCSTYYAEAGA